MRPLAVVVLDPTAVLTRAAVLVQPARLWRTWPVDPLVAGGLAVAAGLYLRGWLILARRPRPQVSGRHAAAFLAGLLLLVVALLSPLDALAGTLLSAHMAQHLILLVVAPPLLAYGRPGLVLFLGLPQQVRQALWRHARRAARGLRLLGGPVMVAVGSSLVLWGWHLPAVYDAAVANPALHAAEHLTFLASAFAVWQLVITARRRRRVSYPAAMVLVFVVMLQSAALGALITFSPVLYRAYGPGAGLWATTALADQQLAGALMWIPPGLVYLVTIAALATHWLAEEERMHPRGVQGGSALAEGPL